MPTQLLSPNVLSQKLATGVLGEADADDDDEFVDLPITARRWATQHHGVKRANERVTSHTKL